MSMLQILAKEKEVLIYRKELKHITSSVTATILLQQMIYWWQKNGKKEFYKFIEPAKHNLYRDGDSWTEELGFSKKEFQIAFKKLENLGVVKKRITRDRVTFYSLAEDKLLKKLDEVYGSIPKCQKERSKNTKGSVPKCQKERSTITETTTETTTSGSSFKFLEDWLEEKCKNAKNKQAYKATLLQKYKAEEQSVLEEFTGWQRQKERQKEIEKLLFFKDKKIILDKSSFSVIGVEKKENIYTVYLQEPYQNSHRINFKNLEEIEKRIQA